MEKLFVINKFTYISFIVLLFTSCSTPVKLFPDELKIWETGETKTERISLLLEQLKARKEKNAAASVLIWSYQNHLTQKTQMGWSYGVSSEGKTCKEAIQSSLNNCALHIEKYHKEDKSKSLLPYKGCYVLAIKCKNVEKELNWYNQLDY